MSRTSTMAMLIYLAVLASAPTPAAEFSFRVMTYNIHHGEGPDGRLDLQRIADVIRAQRADIVVLQEVDRGVERTQRKDLPAELSRLTFMSVVFSNNFHYQGGEYGNAILTRFPVSRWTNTHLPMIRSGEQRGLLQAVLNINGRELAVLGTHLDFHPSDKERLQHVELLRQIAGQYRSTPLILCGDFNDPPGSRVHRKLKEFLQDLWEIQGIGEGFTYSQANPRKRIDYIWATSHPELRPRRVWVPPATASDHLPVLAEFNWASENRTER